VTGDDGSARVVVPGRVRKTAAGGWARGNAVYGHGKEWVEGQDPASRKGATMG
jgi:hypothetical protein